MKYTKPGGSEPNFSRICMGCMGFGIETIGNMDDNFSVSLEAAE